MEENRPLLPITPSQEDFIRYVFSSSNIRISNDDRDEDKYHKGFQTFNVDNGKTVDFILYKPKDILLQDLADHLNDLIQSVYHSDVLIINLSATGTNNNYLVDLINFKLPERHFFYKEIWVYYPGLDKMKKIRSL